LFIDMAVYDFLETIAPLFKLVLMLLWLY